MELQQEDIELEKMVEELLSGKGVSLEDVNGNKDLMECIVGELKFKHKVSVRKSPSCWGLTAMPYKE